MKGERRGGKPLGWRKPEGVRTPHQIKAYPDEWILIQKFARFVKHGHKQDCSEFINKIENANKI